MFRHLTKLNIVFLILISLVLGGVIRFAFDSKAYSTDPVYEYFNTTTGQHFWTTEAGEGSDYFNQDQGTAWYAVGSGDPCAVAVHRRRNASSYYFYSTNREEGAAEFPLYDGVAFYGMNCPVAGSVQVHRRSAPRTSYRVWSTNPYKGAEAGYSTYDGVAFYAMAAPAPVCENVDANNYQDPLPCTFDQDDPPDAPDPYVPDPPDDTWDRQNYDNDVSEEVIVDDPDYEDGGTDGSQSDDTEAPSVPVNLSGSFNDQASSIDLAWDPATDNNIVYGYEVQRQKKGENSWSQVGDVASEEFTDFEFAPDNTYIYQVRAYDDAKNYSAWSSSKEITSGAFKPNVTAADGGTVTDDKKLFVIDVPKGATGEDLVVLVNKIKVKGMNIPKNSKLVGGYYDIKAKNSQGKEVKNFKRQITLKFNYERLNTLGVTKSTLKVSTSEDGKRATLLPTQLDGTDAISLTDHFTYFFMVADKNSPWVTLLWIIFWLSLVGAVIAAGYFGWRKYMLSKYQSEHSEDFIYKH